MRNADDVLCMLTEIGLHGRHYDILSIVIISSCMCVRVEVGVLNFFFFFTNINYTNRERKTEKNNKKMKVLA